MSIATHEGNPFILDDLSLMNTIYIEIDARSLICRSKL
jgi:hypothetical protein